MQLLELSKLNYKNKIIFNISISIILMVLIVYFVIINSILNIKKMSEEINKNKIDLEEKFNRGQSITELSKNISKIQQQLSVFDKIFIDKNNSLDLITTLENSADKYNITQKINLSVPENKDTSKDKTYIIVPITLETSGKFSDQMNYLINLETLNYQININSIKMNSSLNKNSDNNFLENSDNNSIISVSIAADTYWQ
ncbi:hypothetical protein CO115_01205 [Candidatus Falkowbacteria bacterium CG_4_9_14_3_um_filter_36_9]|uniref:Uncharacterized protein n=2 Tax=Candidatus Falkowiibacteriota TaxID=1752728 RepID=A0A1J4T4P4_9BACT|nr:MAG: hypothetical protein AUJ27_03070 [Candidatus Falkowbacteria bacterium CG1_02_37_44]PIV50239.1 MAG: hypothetical protein COS18_05540 [Candidatus Falkowbacteria bacterium CG02_land_8_20_14_3_00_36_14]PIX11806.1 MAG: hypothetical protein COZ73_01785 [Candidatus Falkowbacteria bacterium CG_4_8_14_3_um_filter_36_11]PJA10929.1 MAG: hypothetical protein COX67_02430 [Candidatus Falkowbacteria bacterium CG_4_10_14_0_2_um_filter_36_22]PJB20492.1 MAG: hypothetical protein CO115_01205 [Candidatus F